MKRNLKANTKKNSKVKSSLPFKIIDDIKSDVSFEGYGRDLSELFSSCALAISSISYDVNMVPKIKRIRFSLSGMPELLLYDFLSKILFLIDTKEMFFSGFNVELRLKDLGNKNDFIREDIKDTNSALEREYTLTCECLGAPIASISKIVSKVHIKAITMHNLKILKRSSRKAPKKGYTAHISLDV